MGEIPVTAEIEILRSRSVLGAVVDNLNLEIVADPAEPGLFGAVVKRLFPSDVKPAIQVSSLDVPDSLVGTSFTVTKTGPGAFTVAAEVPAMSFAGQVGESASTTVDKHGELSYFRQPTGRRGGTGIPGSRAQPGCSH